MQSHPTEEKLKGFVEGKANRSQVRTLVAHLLQGCAVCAATAESIVRPKRELPTDTYDEAFDKAFALIQAHLEPPRPMPTLDIRRGVLSLPGSPI